MNGIEDSTIKNGYPSNVSASKRLSEAQEILRSRNIVDSENVLLTEVMDDISKDWTEKEDSRRIFDMDLSVYFNKRRSCPLSFAVALNLLYFTAFASALALALQKQNCAELAETVGARAGPNGSCLSYVVTLVSPTY